MDLYDKLKSIEDAIADILADNPIDGVNGIVVDKELKSGNTNPPYIKVFLDPSPVEGTTLGMKEIWFYRFTIAVVADTYASAEAVQQKRIALKCSSLFILEENRDLNGTVDDTVRRTWQPDFKKEIPSAQLFGAAVEMESRFTLKEV